MPFSSLSDNAFVKRQDPGFMISVAGLLISSIDLFKSILEYPSADDDDNLYVQFSFKCWWRLYFCVKEKLWSVYYKTRSNESQNYRMMVLKLPSQNLVSTTKQVKEYHHWFYRHHRNNVEHLEHVQQEMLKQQIEDLNSQGLDIFIASDMINIDISIRTGLTRLTSDNRGLKSRPVNNLCLLVYSSNGKFNLKLQNLSKVLIGHYWVAFLI